MAQDNITDQDIAGLVRRVADANAALIHGDIDGYLRLIRHAEDYTLMSPFGGAPTRGFDLSPDRLAAIGRFFKGGTAKIEVVETYRSGDLAVLVVIERQRVAVADLPEQDWSLRVTLVFRRDGTGWLLAHRHADGLVNGIGVARAAEIARGEKAS
ncbi:MAG: nuclear transport factor 2 family protein [Dongiaceae bacterium]